MSRRRSHCKCQGRWLASHYVRVSRVPYLMSIAMYTPVTVTFLKMYTDPIVSPPDRVCSVR